MVEPLEESPSPARIEAMLAHREWVRRVAVALTADESAAGDLEQDLWCEVLERPPEPRRSIRGWFAAALRRDLFDRRKAEARRRLREEAAARPEAAPATADLVAEADAHRRVVQAVLELEEPYRTVVLLRWFEDLKPPEIARRQGIPIDTVRTRLRRAIERLRERLVGEAGGDRRAFLAALLPLARRAAPEQAAAGAGAGAAAVAGGILMGTQAKAAVALAALVLLSVLGWRMLPGPGVVEGQRAGSAPPAVATARVVHPTVAAPPTPAASGAATGTPGVVRWVLRGRMEGLAAGEAVPAAIRVFADYDGNTPARVVLRAEADPAGKFELEVSSALAARPRPEALDAVFDHPAYLQAAARVEIPRTANADPTGTAYLEVVLKVRPAAVLVVHVADGAGNPVSGAGVAPFATTGGIPAEFAEDRAVTDAGGTARLRLEPGKPHLVVAARPGLEPAARAVTGGERDVPRFVLRAGVAIEGKVTEGGVPLEGAALLVYPESQEGHWLHLAWGEGDEEAWQEVKVFWEAGTVRADDLAVKTGPDGRYRAAGLRDGKWRVRVESLGPGRRPIGFERFVEAPADGVDFEVATGRVVAEVRSGGKPVPGVRISVGPIVVTDAEGRAVVDLVPGTEFSMQTACKGYREARVQGRSPEAGASMVLPIELEPLPPRGRLVVVVRDPAGKPIPLVGLAFFEPGSIKWHPKETRYRMEDRDGRFVVDDMDPARRRLVVRPGRDWDPDFTWDGDEGTWFDEAFDVEIPASGGKEIQVTARRGGRLRIAARDGKGEILPAECDLRDPEGRSLEPVLVARHGSGAYSSCVGSLGRTDPSDVSEALPPGRYTVRLSLEGFDEQTVEAEVEAGKTRTVDVVLVENGEPRRPPPVMAPAKR
jgi:RNA polymerase sigma-70 factor (ECF subfamily)